LSRVEAPTTPALEALLGAALAQPARIERLDRLSPWAVARCQVRLADGRAWSVIVKWLREHPQGLRTDIRQIATEAAALAFLGELGFCRAPRLIAADHLAGVLVIEDLAPRTPLAERLFAQGLAGLEAEMLDYARCLGELGAATAGRAGRYDAIRAAYGSVDPAMAEDRGFGPQWPTTSRRFAELGLTIPGAVERDFAALLGVLEAPGPFLAFSNGDPQVNNFLVGEGEGKLIDFEGAGFRHALTAAVLIHTPGSFFMAVRAPLCAELEAAYRTALAPGVPQAADDRLFGAGMAAACLAFALERLTRFALLDSRPAGHESRIQMVSTLESAAIAARQHRAFPEATGWVERAAAWLRRHWPDADVDLERYAPYAPRT
jgi:hypothetical protein